MHPAIDLLLKRMESNPEEFMKRNTGRRYRWDRIIGDYTPHMTEEEVSTIKQKYDQIRMDECHKEIMAELLYGGRDEDEDAGEQAKQKMREQIKQEWQKQKALTVKNGGTGNTAPASLPPGAFQPNFDYDLDPKFIQKIKEAMK